MTTREVYANTVRTLAGVSGDDAAFEARLMLCRALGVSAERLIMEMTSIFPGELLHTVEDMTRRRLNREPIQYIFGEWEFMGLPFFTEPCALIPRQDTETLVECAISLIRGRGYASALDVCAGSGCIGISLAKLAGIEVALSDISAECIRLCEKNARLNDVQASFVVSDMFESIRGHYDIITSNPPYIRAEELADLAPEVGREPRLALDGGADGLDYYRTLAASYRRHLSPGGALVMEAGAGQSRDIMDIFGGGRAMCDVNGVERVVLVD